MQLSEMLSDAFDSARLAGEDEKVVHIFDESGRKPKPTINNQHAFHVKKCLQLMDWLYQEIAAASEYGDPRNLDRIADEIKATVQIIKYC